MLKDIRFRLDLLVLMLLSLFFSGCRDIGKGVGPLLLDFLLTPTGLLIFIPTCLIAYVVYLVLKD